VSYHQLILALHLLAIAIGIGIGFSNIVNLGTAKSQSGDIAKGLAMGRLANRKYHDAAVIIILVSGGLLLANLGSIAGISKWFHFKLAMVLVFVVCHFAARATVKQVIATGKTALMGRAKMFSHIAITGAVLALISAVLAFAA
jgi:uncharacterized membrane protein